MLINFLMELFSLSNAYFPCIVLPSHPYAEYIHDLGSLDDAYQSSKRIELNRKFIIRFFLISIKRILYLLN